MKHKRETHVDDRADREVMVVLEDDVVRALEARGHLVLCVRARILQRAAREEEAPVREREGMCQRTETGLRRKTKYKNVG